MVTVEMLKRFPLLAHLPYEDLAELMEICEIEKWEAGQIVGREGDRADRLRLILLGRVALDKRIQLGRLGRVCVFASDAFLISVFVLRILFESPLAATPAVPDS